MAIDFFSSQDNARRNTSFLLIGFVIAVLLTCLLFFAAFGLLIDEPALWWQSQNFLMFSAALGSIIGGVSIFRIVQLRDGGGIAVAESLGGRALLCNSQDAAEIRFANIAREMSIASGIKTPRLYVLDHETAINAFAAGDEPSNAVIAVTRGTLEHLTRDELQGVIAHEFSHVLNGDMRLNLHMIGVLYGIFMLIELARDLMKARFSRLWFIGFIIYCIGSVGHLVGQILRSMISREREFLADAAAVQFTRNADGLASALKKIHQMGSNMQNARAESVSHLFFSSAIDNLLATHPPLEERVARLLDASKDRITGEMAWEKSKSQRNKDKIAQNTSTLSADSLNKAQLLMLELPLMLQESILQPIAARELVLAFFSPHNFANSALCQRLEKDEGVLTAERIIHLQKTLLKFTPDTHFALFTQALTPVTQLANLRQQSLIFIAEEMIQSHAKISLQQHCLYYLLRNAIAGKTQWKSGEEAHNFAADCSLLFSLAAQSSAAEYEQAELIFKTCVNNKLLATTTFVATEAINLQQTSAMFMHLAKMRPVLKEAVLSTTLAMILRDKKITPAEKMLIKTLCTSFDCPLPLEMT